MKPLVDYIGIMRQAEEIECEFNFHVYGEALNLLNNNKAERASGLISDLDAVVSLSLIELEENKKIESEALLMGSLLLLENLIEKRDLIKKILYKNVKPELTPEQELSQKVLSLKESYKKHFKY